MLLVPRWLLFPPSPRVAKFHPGNPWSPSIVGDQKLFKASLEQQQQQQQQQRSDPSSARAFAFLIPLRIALKRVLSLTAGSVFFISVHAAFVL